MDAAALEGGFADVPLEAARAFRQIMNVMARPGEIAVLAGASPPEPLSPAAGALILCLCDTDTGIYLAPGHDTPSVRQWITFHTGAPLVASDAAQFAVGTWEALPRMQFSIGTPEYPDRSATLIVEAQKLTTERHRLTGPGIKKVSALNLPEAEAFQQNAALFPLGLDFFFTHGNRVAALPRTTKVS